MPNDKDKSNIPTLGQPDLDQIAAKQNEPVKLPGILGRGEDYINNKVIQPFRQGLDTIGNGLQADSRKPGLSGMASGLEYGLGALTKAAPVGQDLRSTIAASIVPPELSEEGSLGRLGAGRPRDAVDIMSDHAAQIPKKSWIESAGAKYMGSMPHPKGGDLHYFEDPKTGSTLAMHDNDVKSQYDVKEHMDQSRRQFEKGKK